MQGEVGAASRAEPGFASFVSQRGIPSNIVLRVRGRLQVALALLYLAGGAYKTFSFDEVAKQMTALPRNVWAALGVIEMLGAVVLIVPVAAKWMPGLTPPRRRRARAGDLGPRRGVRPVLAEAGRDQPAGLGRVMGLLAAFVAYGRYVLRPPSV